MQNVTFPLLTKTVERVEKKHKHEFIFSHHQIDPRKQDATKCVMISIPFLAYLDADSQQSCYDI